MRFINLCLATLILTVGVSCNSNNQRSNQQESKVDSNNLNDSTVNNSNKKSVDTVNETLTKDSKNDEEKKKENDTDGDVGINRSTNLDKELTSDYKKMMNASISVRYDSLAPKFKSKIKTKLSKPETIHISFDSLSKKMDVNKSKNEKLRIFSWDEKGGGTWHNMTSFAQYKTSKGQVKVKQLDTDEEASKGGFTDVIIDEIHQITINDKTHYLTIGWGTHGNGNHHVAAQIFRIDGEKLVKCKTCFEDTDYLVVRAPRRSKINMNFNSKTNEITHNQFRYNESGRNGPIGFRPTGKKTTWKLDEGVFKK